LPGLVDHYELQFKAEQASREEEIKRREAKDELKRLEEERRNREAALRKSSMCGGKEQRGGKSGYGRYWRTLGLSVAKTAGAVARRPVDGSNQMPLRPQIGQAIGGASHTPGSPPQMWSQTTPWRPSSALPRIDRPSELSKGRTEKRNALASQQEANNSTVIANDQINRGAG